MREDMQDALNIIVRKGAYWDKMPIGKHQLFLHNLNTGANIWLFFIKKKLILYYIMQEIPVNVSDIIYEHIHATSDRSLI